MHGDSPVPVPNGVARLVPSSALQQCDAWKKAFAVQCKDHRYYEIIEHTLDGFEHHYLLIEDHSGTVRAVQPLFFVRQNLTEGVTGRVRAADRLCAPKISPFPDMRVLMVGCAAGEGHLGACAAEDEAWVAKALHASLRTIARQNKASLVILKDFPAKYRATLSNFPSNGYARVPSMRYTRLALNYGNFDEYLKTLGKATRKNLRRKFRRNGKSAPIELEVVTDVTPHVDEIYPLYQQVHDRSPLKFETLTKDYFRDVGTQMPERTRFFLWRQNGKIIAFSFCLIHTTRSTMNAWARLQCRF